jgi:hypothetical protein
MPHSGFLFGAVPNSINAGIYGFLDNICFYKIDTPLKAFVWRVRTSYGIAPRFMLL